MLRYLIVVIGLLLITGAVVAQDEVPPDPTERVEIETEDGVMLVGDYYHGGAPAVLLLHQLYTTRRSWDWTTAALLDSGYRVLSVDLRGYGESRGAINWTQAQDDVQVWLDWLTDQPGTGQVFVMGSSMGANLALVGCADAPRCDGVVALSPGLNYFGVRTAEAITASEPILLVYAALDMRPRRDIPRMWALAEDAGVVETLSEIVYDGRIHGMDLFDEDETLTGQIIAWMDAHR